MDPKVIKKTQDSLGKHIKKPPLTEKLLNKPPFRFLHDVTTSVVKSTGFMKGLFTEEEMNSENVKEKDSKVVFLQKIIDMVSLVLVKTLSVKPAKIIAGQEPEKTNELLQDLAEAISKKVDNADYVRRVLKNDDKPSGSKREKKGDSDGGDKKEDRKHSDRSRDESTDRSKDKDREKSSDKDLSKDKGREKSSDKDLSKKGREKSSDKDLSKDKDREKSSDKAGSKDKDREKSSDKARSKDKESSKGPDGRRDRDKDKGKDRSKDRHDQEKSRDKGEKHRDREDRHKSRDRDDKQKDHESRRRDKDKSGDDRRGDEKAEKREHRKHREKEEPKEDQAVNGHAEQEDLPPRMPRPSSAKGSRRRHGHEEQHVRDRERSPKSRVTVGEDDLPPQVANARKMARPSSARPAPPRVKKEGQEEAALIGSSNVPNLITDKDVSDDDDDDEGFLAKEEDVPQNMAAPLAKDEDDDEEGEHGGLVKKILETKKGLEGGSQQPGRKTEIERSQVPDATRRKEREMIQKEIDKLRTSIQTLTRSVNPLGKILDFVQEDLDSMQKEFIVWQKENRDNTIALQREQSVTESYIEPLKAELKELEAAIADQLDLIAAVKNNMNKNDDRIEKMLSTVTKS